MWWNGNYCRNFNELIYMESIHHNHNHNYNHNHNHKCLRFLVKFQLPKAKRFWLSDRSIFWNAYHTSYYEKIGMILSIIPLRQDKCFIWGQFVYMTIKCSALEGRRTLTTNVQKNSSISHKLVYIHFSTDHIISTCNNKSKLF